MDQRAKTAQRFSSIGQTGPNNIPSTGCGAGILPPNTAKIQPTARRTAASPLQRAGQGAAHQALETNRRLQAKWAGSTQATFDRALPDHAEHGSTFSRAAHCGGRASAAQTWRRGRRLKAPLAAQPGQARGEVWRGRTTLGSAWRTASLSLQPDRLLLTRADGLRINGGVRPGSVPSVTLTSSTGVDVADQRQSAPTPAKKRPAAQQPAG